MARKEMARKEMETDATSIRPRPEPKAMHPYCSSVRRRLRRVKVSDYCAALDTDAYADALAIFEQLPYREWRVPGYEYPVIVSRRCGVVDTVLSLYPGEGRLGPWRVLIKDRTVGLGLDDLVTYSPDIKDAERARLVKAGVVYY